ncbi:MAG: bifunctional diaminohydroxyphosphoribosylaminopyrimidine deaminase/5-amino-6-(5-phosphoribosylamino)uracil reductase RibD [Chitinophagaceae bacterium]|nr:bifunctional diaminohydroxyphosphoribosylaminopyrimidine deaminase/5-amino-6-(5-phosphoribosylamino)uracil reductase RibD [Chitinophagaceae bacterium]MCW5926702.1 bifunctional diaminohydroxyphosphoribosylaminopyrimidine deaminase/5-amino-6-(5-phosphoribosylamino)uracil reductase RibD [Chitinophagaceae bacterium]
MERCLQLAKAAVGKTAPNPMVGAVLVYNGRIIGEGYHGQYGAPHAEVKSLRSVRETDRQFIAQSTLYVSLEPCVHFGKTPPCADLIIKERIPQVVVGCRDPFPAVNGKGIERLEAAGIQVEISELEAECRELNKRFFLFHTQHRPYIILKWAETANGFIGHFGGQRLLISNEYTNRLVHRWRGEEAAILVGTHTALLDNPSLTTRLWPGKNPLRVVIDRELSLPGTLGIFDGAAPTLVFNRYKNTLEDFRNPGFDQRPVQYYQVTTDVSLVQQMLHALYHLDIQSLLVEGGAGTLQSFIDEQCWDEARVITNTTLRITEGVRAPKLENSKVFGEQKVMTDLIRFFERE